MNEELKYQLRLTLAKGSLKVSRNWYFSSSLMTVSCPLAPLSLASLSCGRRSGNFNKSRRLTQFLRNLGPSS